ncbi:MAG: DUF92 domain-containing protein [Calditrichaeota bacterium]|nr:MAG: DUF92 domain-containing protein [Calditrichota bacterium]MBL1204171.1 DUF92 domain-containing protein [Calditrichota bacterium]NOG44001.1 DUF92 domain-containing protein [Calditrichota bacterium]
MNLFDYIPFNANQWFVVLYFFCSLTLLLGLAEVISRVFKLEKEFSRKFIHIIVGLLVVLFSLNIVEPQPIIFLSLTFTILNFLIQKFKLLPAMESDRLTYGTTLYPFSIALAAIFLWEDYKLIFIIVVLIIALADAAAAIVGQASSNPVKYIIWRDEKSLQGNAAMFVSSYVIITVSYFLFPDMINFTPNHSIFIIAFVASFVISISESISSKGSDNFSVMIFATLVMYVFFHGESEVQQQFIEATIFAILFSGLTFKFKLLTLDGSISAALVAILIYGFGSWEFTIPLLLFFFSSSILSKTGKNLKHQFKLVFEKSSKRDGKQVFANGGIAVIWATSYFFYPSELIYYFYIVSVAAANADTWATELGVFSKSKPRLITTFLPVEKGRSGGISLTGSFASLMGSFVVSLTGLWMTVDLFTNLNLLLFLTLAGFFASFVDSFLGATLQAQYMNTKTNQITEKALNIQNEKNKLISGYAWLDNDLVNFLSILTAPLFYFLFSLVI